MPTEAEFLALQSRLNELEEKLQAVYRRLDMDYSGPASDPSGSFALQDALRQGNKIEAIKLYREMTGAGLAQAKSAVDEIERKLLLR